MWHFRDIFILLYIWQQFDKLKLHVVVFLLIYAVMLGQYVDYSSSAVRPMCNVAGIFVQGICQ